MSISDYSLETAYYFINSQHTRDSICHMEASSGYTPEPLYLYRSSHTARSDTAYHLACAQWKTTNDKVIIYCKNVNMRELHSIVVEDQDI